MALASMDIARKRQAMARLQAAPEFVAYDPSPAGVGALLDDLSRLAQESMKLSRELWVWVRK